MLRTTRLSARSASVYLVHVGPGRSRRGTLRKLHALADDTQLYVHCSHDEVTSAVLRLENCIEDVSDWMLANRLKLNADKTELLWPGHVTSVRLCWEARGGSILAAQNRDGRGE